MCVSICKSIWMNFRNMWQSSNIYMLYHSAKASKWILEYGRASIYAYDIAVCKSMKMNLYQNWYQNSYQWPASKSIHASKAAIYISIYINLPKHQNEFWNHMAEHQYILILNICVCQSAKASKWIFEICGRAAICICYIILTKHQSGFWNVAEHQFMHMI